MKKNKIGYVIEETFGEEPVSSEQIMLSQVQYMPKKKAKIEKTLTVDARFECPCCGKGIKIKIDAEI